MVSIPAAETKNNSQESLDLLQYWSYLLHKMISRVLQMLRANQEC